MKIFKDNLSDAQARMKHYANAKRTERCFDVGDFVFLQLQQYHQTTAASQSYSKLSPRFHGPFRVLEKVRLVAYKLRVTKWLSHSSSLSCLTSKETTRQWHHT